MKNMNSFFNLIMKPLYILVLLFVMINPLSAASNSCDGDVVYSSFTGTISSANSNDYYQYSPGAGTLSISFTSTERINFYVGSSCNDNGILSKANASSGSATVTLSATDTVYIHVSLKSKDSTYSVNLNFAGASNTPEINISPSSTTISEGTSSVTLSITATPAPNNAGLNVTYSYDGNSYTIPISQGSSSSDIVIDTSSMTAGSSATVTVTGSTGSDSSQNGGTLGANSVATITIEPPEPSNTPEINIAPLTVTVPEGTASILLTVTASEAPNKDKLTVDYINSYDSSTGSVDIVKDTNTAEIVINTSSIPAGTNFTVTLTQAAGSGDQNNATLGSDISSAITVEAFQCGTNEFDVGLTPLNTTYTGTSSVYERDSNRKSDDLYTVTTSESGYITATVTSLSNGVNMQYDKDGCPSSSTVGGSQTIVKSFSEAALFRLMVNSDADFEESYDITIVFTPNAYPIANDKIYRTPNSVSLAGNLMTAQGAETGVADSDSDGDILSVISHTSPSHGIVTVNADGSFVYTPDTSFVDGDSFTYTISDGRYGEATATITINSAGNNPPIANDKTYATPLDTVLVGNAITAQGANSGLADSDPNGDIITIVANTSPANGTLSISANGSFTYTPNTDYSGLDSFTYTITDTHSETATATIHIEVSNFEGPADVTITKVASEDRVIINTDFFYTIDVSNIGGEPAANVVVVDTLPNDMGIDISLSDSSSINWDCLKSLQEITCTLDRNITSGGSERITLYVTAPSYDGNITNVATVTADDENITTNNTAESEIYVRPEPQLFDSTEHLCYRDTTEVNANCKRIGNFWYGNGCTAKVLIDRTDGYDETMLDLNVTKMYAPTIDEDDGACSTTLGSCEGPVPFKLSEESSYIVAYTINAGTMNADTNFTISDTNSYYKNKDLEQIAIYATYEYSNDNYSGRLLNCDGLNEGGVTILSAADAVDPFIHAGNYGLYNSSTSSDRSIDDPEKKLKYIRTMVAGETRTITGVHLDVTTRQAKKFTSPDGTTIPYTIIPYLVEDDGAGACGGNAVPIYSTLLDDAGKPLPLVIEIANNGYSGQGTIVVPFEASNLPRGILPKKARLQLIMVDPNSFNTVGLDCMARSSTTGNLARISQCANSALQYKSAFAVDAYDRCSKSNGDPCTSEHGGYSGKSDPTYPGYNPLYDNELGCYMCTFNVKPSCSTDNFAIRPDIYTSSVTDTDGPNLLRSGQGYGIALTAINRNASIATSYNVTESDMASFGTTSIKYFRDDTKDTNNILHGDTLVTPVETGNPQFVAGKSSTTASEPPTAEEILNFSYTDVGKLHIFVYDPDWAAVDNKDTAQDCNSSQHTYICGEQNATFIPHHFEFKELNITNHAGPTNNFTYIANERDDMSAKLQVKIAAVREDGNITQNFRADDGAVLYYENEVYFDFTIDVNNTIYPNPDDLNYVPPAGEPDCPVGVGYECDANETELTEANKAKIGFGPQGPNVDDAGTRTILWNESNPDYRLMFNYSRRQDRAANPFTVTGDWLTKMAIYSEYTDPVDGDIAIIQGISIGDKNTTTVTECDAIDGCMKQDANGSASFLYGRAQPSKLLYDDIRTNSVTTPVSVWVYCGEGPDGTLRSLSECAANNIDWVNGRTNDADWWVATAHSSARNDGNVSVTIGSGAATVAPTDPALLTLTNGIDATVVVTATGAVPLTTDIVLGAETSPWLIYNEASDILAPNPFYRVRFTGGTGWSGVGNTGNTVNTDANEIKARRLNW